MSERSGFSDGDRSDRRRNISKGAMRQPEDATFDHLLDG
jgi:hypothetical protein